MLRVQHLLIPAVLLGCLTVIFLTNQVSQPGEVSSTSLSDQISSTGPGLLAWFNLETTTEVPSRTSQKLTGKSKPKPAKSGSPSKDTSAGSIHSGQSVSPSDCSVSTSYPEAVRQWCMLIDRYALAQDLDPNLIAAVILEESGGNPQAYSSSGAVGLMQIMPHDGLAASFACGSSPCFSSRPSMSELYDPEFNISFGTSLLGGLNRKYGNLRDALQAYGPANLGYYYADIVLAIFDRYK